MLGGQVDSYDETTSRSRNDLDDNEYVDYSVISNTGDEDLDDSDTDDGMNDTYDNVDRTNTHRNVNNERCDLSHSLDEPEGTQPQKESQIEPTIVYFPGRRPGEVYSEGIMGMQEYENALGGLSENPYSPFASKIDWELAKWAKLRGPSATSFTELLDISGVSAIQRPLRFIISLPSSSCPNNWLYPIQVLTD